MEQMTLMMQGQMYDSSDTELVKLRAKCRQLLTMFNARGGYALAGPVSKVLLPNVSLSTVIEPTFQCDYGFNIITGFNVFINFNCVFLDANTIHIGDRTLIGPSVQLYTASHPKDAKLRMLRQAIAKPIVIGKDCWIGGGSVICPGVTIGDGAIVGAGSVVTKDIPANCVYAGNPAKYISSTI